jgi:eukaryotic-like serine/threonine-protein kinase
MASLSCRRCGTQLSPESAFCPICGLSQSRENQMPTTRPSQRHSGGEGTGKQPAGRILHQRYRLLHTVGQGGMGAVYIAQDLQLGDRLVAIKEMSLSRLTGQEVPQAVEQFRREAHLLASLHHPYLPVIHEYFPENDRWYLVMSFIEGQTLHSALEEAPGQRFSVNEVVRIGIALCEVLEYLHQHEPQVIFRDLKPLNIMLTPKGGVCLIDFGIARHFKQGQTKDTVHYYTVGYAPPEQYGLSQTGPRSDIYSLGATLHQMLSGHSPVNKPFQFANLRLVDPAIPAPLARLISKMVAMSEQARPASVGEVKTRLERMLKPKSREAAEKTGLGQRANETTLAVSQDTLASPPVQEHVVLLVRRLRLSMRQTAAILFVIVLLLLALTGGSYAYLTAVNTYDIQATATARATSIATIKNYADYVATQGIMFGFDAGRTRYNPYERTINTTNVSRLQQKWAAPTGDIIFSSPAVANGVVYVGSEDDKLYAFDVVTGEQKWVSVPTGNVIDSSPAVVNGVVYVGSYDHKLYAFDTATGGRKWVASTGNIVDSSPAVVNGVVYVGSLDRHLYAFDAATGRRKWVSAPTGDIIESSPAVANGVVYVGCHDDKLYAFDAATGGQKWVASTGNAIYSAPVVVNGVVYVGSSDHKLYAFDAATGGQKWVASTGSIIFSSPAVANGVVYIGSHDDKLYAFDATTGGQKWVSASTGGSVNSSPAVANGMVYVGSSNGYLYAFDATTGGQKWVSAPTSGSIISSPAVADGVVYVGSYDHKLYAFSLS